MKRYLSLLLAFGLLFFWSCSKDFLERYPLDELSPQVYFKTANDLKLYANRFYPLIPAHSGYGGGTFWAEKNSDNLVPGAFDIRLSGTRTVPSKGEGWDWGNIRQTNYFLDHCSEANDDPANIKIYIAEVKFFKALLYFDKVKTFGDVLWITKALNTTSPELFAQRDSRKVVVDSIISCLDYAIANLKPKSQAEPFRINMESALLMKARICLYEGTWEKYHKNTAFGVQGEDGTGFIQMAATTADKLMSMGSFSLYRGPAGKEYWSLFNKLDYSDNPEVLLWKKYDVALGVYHHVSSYLSSGAGDIGISKSLIDSYLCADGKPISVSPDFMGYDSLSGEVMNRDPRLAQSIFLRGYDQTINSPGGSADIKFVKPAIDLSGQFRATTGYCIYKGVNPEYSQHTSSGGWMGSIILRYSEALLIYAEAKAELGTITQADIDKTVNAIRDRVGMIHLDMSNITIDPNWDFPTLSPVINEIRRERRVELAFETQRWDDLARWRAHDLITGNRPRGCKYIGSNLEGTYADYLGNPSIALGQNLFVDADGFIDPYKVALPAGFGFNPGRDYLSPIPSDEITLNSKLVQNPGWE
jgi:starch-binding outer membrane protein, SusD/RagB family